MISAKQAYKAAAAPISREVRGAFAVVEPHVPRPVGCEDLRASVTSCGLGASTAMSEAGFQPPRSTPAHQSFLGQRAADWAATRCSGVRCSVIAARIWPTRAPSSNRTDLLPS